LDARKLLKTLDLAEDTDLEFKSARGGVPGSLWETYSGMANTDGGTILLGVEIDGTISGLPDPAKARKTVWDSLNNRGVVSVNLLSNEQVRVVPAGDHSILMIEVPRANRRQRPVYTGQNPITGTYRRNYEGDYHCNPDEVGRMLADQSEEPADSRILEHFGIDDLDPTSVQQYRQRFSARAPDHPWLSLDHRGFLTKLGAWRRDRATKQEGLTVAGLLMFGKDEAIRDPAAVPGYQVDFREKLSPDPSVRWTDRLTVDGTWVANLFQFYQRVIQRLTVDLKLPFQLGSDLFRRDETLVHEAIREALVNALIHADYRGQGGIVVEKYRHRIELSNPGSLLLSLEQVWAGGVSECRNKSLQTMFLMIGGGEKAGSGIDKIRQGWKAQHWRLPIIRERVQPDRVVVVLPMVSLLPEESLQRLRSRFGPKFNRLDRLEIQALVTADLEGSVSNRRLQEVCDEHPADLTKLLHNLVARGFLHQDGQKRWASYRLVGVPERAATGLSPTAGDSSHKPDSSHKGVVDLSHKIEDLPPKVLTQLKGIAAPARHSTRLPPEETRRIILVLCEGRYFTAVDLAQLMDRNSNSLRNRFLTPMVDDGLLERKYPEEPNRPDQAYTRARSPSTEG
jgi:ATP-dependent DNA helicase RecG